MLIFRKIGVRLRSMLMFFRYRRLAKQDRVFRSLMKSIRENAKIPIREEALRRMEANELARQDKERSIQDRGITGMV